MNKMEKLLAADKVDVDFPDVSGIEHSQILMTRMPISPNGNRWKASPLITGGGIWTCWLNCRQGRSFLRRKLWPLDSLGLCRDGW